MYKFETERLQDVISFLTPIAHLIISISIERIKERRNEYVYRHAYARFETRLDINALKDVCGYTNVKTTIETNGYIFGMFRFNSGTNSYTFKTEMMIDIFKIISATAKSIMYLTATPLGRPLDYEYRHLTTRANLFNVYTRFVTKAIRHDSARIDKYLFEKRDLYIAMSIAIDTTAMQNNSLLLAYQTVTLISDSKVMPQHPLTNVYIQLSRNDTQIEYLKLLEKQCDPNNPRSIYQPITEILIIAALKEAIQAHAICNIDYLLQKEPKLNRSIMRLAIDEGDYAIIRCLISNNYPCEDSMIEDLCCQLIDQWSINKLKLLLSTAFLTSGYKPTKKMMKTACDRNNYIAVQCLIEHGYPASDELIEILCIELIYIGHQWNIYEIELLIALGVKPTIGMLCAAARCGNLPLVDLFLAANCPVNHPIESPLVDACCNSDLVVVMRLLEAGAVLDGPNSIALFAACSFGYYHIVKVLLRLYRRDDIDYAAIFTLSLSKQMIEVLFDNINVDREKAARYLPKDQMPIRPSPSKNINNGILRVSVFTRTPTLQYPLSATQSSGSITKTENSINSNSTSSNSIDNPKGYIRSSDMANGKWQSHIEAISKPFANDKSSADVRATVNNIRSRSDSSSKMHSYKRSTSEVSKYFSAVSGSSRSLKSHSSKSSYAEST
jgi:hypothetical protein